MVILAVHPDDESLSAGGLIQQAVAHGGTVRVVVVTNGDNNPWPQRYVERRWRIDAEGRARWGNRRQQEAVAALGCLGVPPGNIAFWNHPDQGLTQLLQSGADRMVAQLASSLAEWQPTLLVAPSLRDLHPDHNALAVLMYFAFGRDASPQGAPFPLVKYLVHTHGENDESGRFEITLAPEQIERKRQAILSHATQMALSRGRFVAFAKASEIFLPPSRSTANDASHPVSGSVFSGNQLRLQFARTTPHPTLLLVGQSARGSLSHSVSLSGRNALTVVDTITGDLLAPARVVRGPGHEELLLPAAMYASATRLLVKVIDGRGFYDRDGWRELPTPATSEAVASVSGKPASKPRVCCVVPCYNLAGICGPIVRAAARFADDVIAINDGSRDDTEQVLRRVAAECPGRVHVMHFPVNRGKGVALLEAFRHACEAVPFDILVTMDGDGQHRAEDIPRLAEAVVAGQVSFVIGERPARVKMPLRSRIGNTLTAAVMKLLYPAAPTDTQSGLRAFHHDFVREIVDRIQGGRYETELEILLLALKQGRRIGSVTIPTVYLDGNRLSHFRPLIDSGRIYRTLFRWQFTRAANLKLKRDVEAGELVHPEIGAGPV